MRRAVIDIETPGLNPNEIYLVGLLDLDTGEFRGYAGDDVAEGIAVALECDLLVGHWLNGFDLRTIERLAFDGEQVFDRSKTFDTCTIAKALFPSLPSHKLADLGELVGMPKLTSPDFSKPFDAAIWTPYCQRDCEACAALFRFLLDALAIRVS